MSKHPVKPLPYANDALKGIGAKTMEIHHGKHHQAYINNLNAALKDHPDHQGKTIEALTSHAPVKTAPPPESRCTSSARPPRRCSRSSRSRRCEQPSTTADNASVA